eukprot:scaffold3408_cov129-Amphora_coffeaeformis.AAC.8
MMVMYGTRLERKGKVPCEKQVCGRCHLRSSSDLHRKGATPILCEVTHLDPRHNHSNVTAK